MNDAKQLIVVIDTQLFLRAAVNANSLAAKLIFDLQQHYLLTVSREIRAEIVGVLNRPKLRAKFVTLTDARIAKILAILDRALNVELHDVPPVSRDPKDDIFLATAVASNADYLVSEDNDLLVLKTHGKTQIINALEYLRILQPS